MTAKNNADPAPIYLTYSRNLSNIAGYFDPDDGRIYISANQPKLKKDLVYIHERQHKRCWDSGCFCWYEKDVPAFWCEYHAFRAELKYVIEQNSIRLFQYYFREVFRALKKYEKPIWPCHFNALAKVCGLKRFKECAKLYGDMRKINALIKKVKHG